MQPTVLITSENFGRFSREGRHVLETAGLRVIDNPYGHTFLHREQILPFAGEADGIICDMEKIDREVIDAAPRLKIIARRGVGIDSVDWRYAQSKGIEVARTTGVVERPVAELVMGYILEFSRHISAMSSAMHAGRWQRISSHSVTGHTLGIVGMGNIAWEVARRAAAFDMRILYYSHRRNERAEEAFGAQYAPLETLLGEADFVSLHVPLTEETRHMMDAQALACMKKGAYLINTARGAVVAAQALADALRSGQLGGAAIDVFDGEPCTDSPLHGLDSVILTPHIGTYTQEIYVRMDVEAARNAVRCLTC